MLQRSRLRLGVLIIGLALLAAGCSALRLAYGQAPNLAYWWLDAYVDFDGAQTTKVRGAIDEWFAWHRRTQLPDYVALLERAQVEALADTTPAQVCGWWDTINQRIDTLVPPALPAVAELAASLTPEQVRHMEHHFEKTNDEIRSEMLQSNPRERERATLKRTVDRVETLYGSITGAQRDWLAQALARSPWDPNRYLAERRARQREIANAARSLARTANMTPVPRAQAESVVRNLIATLRQGGDEAARRYHAQVNEFNCTLVAQLHNQTDRGQRQHAADKLRGYADDLRTVIGPAATSPARSTP